MKKRINVNNGLRRIAAVFGLNGTTRDYNTILGYPDIITFDNYYTRYKRQDIATAIISRTVKYTWKGGVLVHNPDVETDDMLKGWKSLWSRLRLDIRFRTVDILGMLGEYSILLLGFDDVTSLNSFIKPITPGKRNLLYVTPYSQNAAKIVEFENNPNNERFGKPLIYEISTSQNSKEIRFKVHHSRVLHVAGEILTSDVYGVPFLEKVYNRLVDVEKISGGSSEMFWRGARPGYQGVIDKDFEADENLEQKLQSKIKAYEDNLSRIIIAEGLELKSLDTQVEDPTSYLNVQIELISAATGIPKRILLGSERGELSSQQDSEVWADFIDDRRSEIAETQIIRPFVEICKRYQILPDENYTIEWRSLHLTNEKDVAEIGRIRASALRSYVANPLAFEIMPPEAFMKYLLGMTPEQINEILSMIKADAFDIDGVETDEKNEE